MAAIDMIDSWLDEKPCTLWGQAFDINDPDSRRVAAGWFKDQVEGFYEHNGGCAIQLADDDIDIEHLRTEHEAAIREIERLRGDVKELRTRLTSTEAQLTVARLNRERMPYKVDL